MDDPAWSPDGTKIAYNSGYGEISTYSVWVMNSDGSEKIQLTHDPLNNGSMPTWSPDGTQIAFINYSGDPPTLQVYVMHADGSDVRPLTSGAAGDLSPTWAPNGTILFLRRQIAGSRFGNVFAVRPDGSDLVQLTTGWAVGDYALSPDGRKIAVHDMEHHRIVVLPTDGSRPPQTLVETDFGAYTVALAWSPDGEAVVMAGSAGLTGSDLYIVNADGSDLTTVPNAHSVWNPAWGPR